MGPLHFPDPVVLGRQSPHTVSVWGCLMIVFLGIINHSFQLLHESGTPYSSLFFQTHITQPCLSGGSASISVIFCDHILLLSGIIYFILIYFLFLLLKILLCLYSFTFIFYSYFFFF